VNPGESNVKTNSSQDRIDGREEAGGGPPCTLRQQIILLASLISLAATCRGSIWESSSWTLLGTATGRTGYDSNLTFNSDGLGDGFGTADGGLKLERLNSLAKTEIDADAAETVFWNHRAPSQLDASALLSIQYPVVDYELPQYAVSAGWVRTTAADPELNERLTVEKSTADIGGRVVTSGQFGLDADVDSYLYDYTTNGLGRNYQTELKLGPAFNPTPLTELSANFSAGWGESSGNATMPAPVRDTSEAYTLQYKGEILPKVTSSIFGGVTHVSYRGGFEQSSTLPTSGGELAWTISPGEVLSGGVSLTTGFAPDGETQRTQAGTLDYRQNLGDLWSIDLLFKPERYSDRSTGSVRTDTNVSGGVTLTYAPSGRFEASVGYNPMHQTSNLAQADFTRSLVFLQATFHI
jgi:hypothetical protein